MHKCIFLETNEQLRHMMEKKPTEAEEQKTLQS